jgi:predicted ATPase
MAPSKETRVSDPPILALPRHPRSPLIGRERELAILSEQLAEARAGHCSVVLLSGPSGVGKSRLLEEFPHEQLVSGVTVLRGGTVYHGANSHFGVWRTAISDEVVHRFRMKPNSGFG